MKILQSVLEIKISEVFTSLQNQIIKKKEKTHTHTHTHTQNDNKLVITQKMSKK